MTIMLIHVNLLPPLALARAHARPEWTTAGGYAYNRAEPGSAEWFAHGAA